MRLIWAFIVVLVLVAIYWRYREPFASQAQTVIQPGRTFQIDSISGDAREYPEIEQWLKYIRNQPGFNTVEVVKQAGGDYRLLLSHAGAVVGSLTINLSDSRNLTNATGSLVGHDSKGRYHVTFAGAQIICSRTTIDPTAYINVSKMGG